MQTIRCIFSTRIKKQEHFTAKVWNASEKRRNFALANEKTVHNCAALHGSLAQLNRASDYGSEGYRFESCRSHQPQHTCLHGSLAQLNRASDYGSEGYRFESCRSHQPQHARLHGSLAQLNRASDYGSEGYRFESCRSHQPKPHGGINNPGYIKYPGFFVMSKPATPNTAPQKASVMRAFRHTDSCKPFDEKNFYIKSRTTENKFKLPPTSYKTAVTDPYTSPYLTHKTCNIGKE